MNETAIKEKGYTQGLNDAWNLAIDAIMMDYNVRQEVFGSYASLSPTATICGLTGEEAMTMFRDYKNKIHTGDIVRMKNKKINYVVTRATKQDDFCYIMSDDGTTVRIAKDALCKTGDQIMPELANFLEKIKQNNEN